MISESILSKLDAIQANALKIAAQRDEAVKDAEDWQVMATELAKALEYANERLTDLEAFDQVDDRKDLLVRYNRLLNRNRFVSNKP